MECYEHINESSEHTKCEKFREQLSKYQFVKDRSLEVYEDIFKFFLFFNFHVHISPSYSILHQ